MTGGRQDRQRAGLSSAHDGANIVLAKDTLDRHGVRSHPHEQLLEGPVERQQTGTEIGGRIGAHHVNDDQAQPATGQHVNHAKTAPSQPGVHAKYPSHIRRRRHNEHVFDSNADCRAARGDAPSGAASYEAAAGSPALSAN